MQCLRCQHENRSGAKFCEECGTPLADALQAGPPGASYADLQHALSESLDQQTATSEVLRVISQSPTDVQPVFDAVAESAARLCASLDAHIFRRHGDRLHLVAHHGSIPIQFTLPLVRGTANGRAVLDGRAVHIVDMQTEVDEFPEGSENARRMGHRTTLNVPLLRGGVAIGAIGVRRTEALLFTERQVALLRTFADQAVIAIENVRLFNELEARNAALTQSLEQQTATAEILRVISSSPTEVEPVFQAIVQSAASLCEATFATLHRFDGHLITFEAHHGMTETEIKGANRIFPRPTDRETAVGRTILDRRITHIHDVRLDPDYRVEATQQDFRTCWRCRCYETVRRWAHWVSGGARFGPSPTRRSNCSRPLPTRPSLRSRTSACSRSWRRATAT